jgi:ABC-type lipoprotein release transport system permease subunit
MFLLLRLAWRNSLRNKRRTILAGLAIGIGLASLIFVDALIIGMSRSMSKVATDTFLGEGQIHGSGFRDTLEVEKTIVQSDHVLKALAAEKAVKVFAPRTLSFAMVSSPANASSVLLCGVEPGKEAALSKLDEATVQGEFLTARDDEKIILGSKLAETLEVGVGDRVVATVAQAGTGELSQGMFRVGGIFRFNIREMDGEMAVVTLSRAQKMLGLETRIHEIAMQFDPETPPGPGFWTSYSQNGNEALPWQDILPELGVAIQYAEFSILILGFILFGIVSLGIMNTLFMSLYERMFEFGVLRAVGTRPLRMVLMILCEAAVLSLISILIGSALGFGLTWFFAERGFNVYTGLEYGGITLTEPIFPVLKTYQFYKYPFYLFVLTLLVGLYPAVVAAKIRPAKAMQRSL